MTTATASQNSLDQSAVDIELLAEGVVLNASLSVRPIDFIGWAFANDRTGQ